MCLRKITIKSSSSQLAFIIITVLASFMSVCLQARGEASQMPERGLCAHRGDQGIAPENTVPAFVAAARAGAQQIEFDVQRTKDGKLVIMHDRTVDRTTTGKGLVKELTLNEIKSFNIKRGNSVFKDLKVPTFEEAIDSLPQNVWVNIHIDCGEGVGADACRIVMKKDRLHQVFFAVGKSEMDAIRSVSHDAKICCMERQSSPKQYLKNAIDWKCDFIQLTHNYSAEEIKKLKDAGIKINFFGTDDPDKIRKLLNDGVDFPLVDLFTKDWPVVEELGGYSLNEVSPEYLKKSEDYQLAPKHAKNEF